MLRIGVVLIGSPESGGLYQYGLTLLDQLTMMRRAGTLAVDLVFVDNTRSPDAERLRRDGWRVLPLLPEAARFTTRLRGALGRVSRSLGIDRAVVRSVPALPTRVDPDAALRPRPEVGRWLRTGGAEIVLYSAPTELAAEAGIPFVMPVHDLQHRLQPEFPEVTENGEFERREYLFRNAVRRAALLLTDSEVGREDLIRLYRTDGASPERVAALPFLPPPYLTGDVSEDARAAVRARYALPDRYFFYPAQFWPHKNHVRIVEAIALLARDDIRADVVFAGSHSGALRERTRAAVRERAEALGVADRVRELGYVPDADMAPLYAEAVALVMPTFFGPTNIPVLEAWAFGCAVITSDIRGIREQVGDAAELVDPRSAEAIAKGMRRTWLDEIHHAMLVERGRTRLAAYTPAEYRRRLREALERACTLVEAWS